MLIASPVRPSWFNLPPPEPSAPIPHHGDAGKHPHPGRRRPDAERIARRFGAWRRRFACLVPRTFVRVRYRARRARHRRGDHALPALRHQPLLRLRSGAQRYSADRRRAIPDPQVQHRARLQAMAQHGCLTIHLDSCASLVHQLEPGSGTTFGPAARLPNLHLSLMERQHQDLRLATVGQFAMFWRSTFAC
jgi:hypothetical protein